MTGWDESKLHPTAATTEATSPPTHRGAVRGACPALLSYYPGSPASRFCSTKLQAGSKLCFLSVVWEVSESWGWGGSGWGRVFQVELPLGIGKQPYPTSLYA